MTITNINSKFPILVINLEKREDRWKNVLTQLEKINPILDKIYKIKATDDVSAEKQKYNYICKKTHENIIDTKSTTIMPTWGALGCAISHIFCWKYIVDKNIEYALVCEDDIYIKNSDLAFDIFESYHFIREQEIKHLFNNIIFFDADTSKSTYKLFDNIYNLYKITSGYITKSHLYLINKHCAEFMINNIFSGRIYIPTISIS